jgi:hypothetical protein
MDDTSEFKHKSLPLKRLGWTAYDNDAFAGRAGFLHFQLHQNLHEGHIQSMWHWWIYARPLDIDANLDETIRPEFMDSEDALEEVIAEGAEILLVEAEQKLFEALCIQKKALDQILVNGKNNDF